MFVQVESLLKLCLLSPASPCAAERSFSTFRRLKTYLRSTMTQNRLNSLMLCQIHNKYASNMDDKQIAKIFVEANRGTRIKFSGIIIYYITRGVFVGKIICCSIWIYSINLSVLNSPVIYDCISFI